MGLHLNWELRLPAMMTNAEVTGILQLLHRRASSLPFEEVTPVFDPVTEESPGDLADYLRLWSRVIAKPDIDDDPKLFGDVTTSRGFAIYPGRRCEGAVFAFQRRAAADGSSPEWFWHCCCKTQYASVVSDAHLITCHTSLAALLDYAMEIGVNVIVRDEAHYWETRDTSRLLAEVHAFNQVMARLAGAFGDALDRNKGYGAVGSPIFDHPAFESLEMGEDVKRSE